MSLGLASSQPCSLASWHLRFLVCEMGPTTVSTSESCRAAQSGCSTQGAWTRAWHVVNTRKILALTVVPRRPASGAAGVGAGQHGGVALLWDQLPGESQNPAVSSWSPWGVTEQGRGWGAPKLRCSGWGHLGRGKLVLRSRGVSYLSISGTTDFLLKQI